MQYCCIVVVFVILNRLIYAVIVAPRRIIGRITVFRLERRVYVINQETVFFLSVFSPVVDRSLASTAGIGSIPPTFEIHDSYIRFTHI
jgi:hypothetical protein